MATTLTRPATQQPDLAVAPNRIQVTLLVVVAALATAVLVVQVADPAPSDASHEVAEHARQMTLAPLDESSDEAEYARQATLGTLVGTDESHQVAEATRMKRLVPVTDDSFERNEAARQAGLGG